MPNHIINIVTIKGDKDRVKEILEEIKDDEIGYGSIDFNKIDPMPKDLEIDSGTLTDRGLKYYKEFVSVYTAFQNRTKDELLNIPEDKEKIFLRQRKGIDSEEWKLGRQAYRNELKYGAPTWYEWAYKHWGTKWNAYGYDYDCGLVSDDKISFETAWCSPMGILQKLSEKYPDVGIAVEWADECRSNGCGRYEYRGGKLENDFYTQDEYETENTSERLWHDGLNASVQKFDLKQ